MSRKFFLAIVCILIAALALVYVRIYLKQPQNEGQMCTLEAKLCPDGSYVGRTGPHCEFAACPSATSTENGATTTPSYNSGITGTVILGPTCPVEKNPPDPACAPKPYATSISVYQGTSQTPFLIGNSNSSGIFTFSLPPGSYRLVARGGKTLPRCADVTVAVITKEYASTTISCDSGIR